MVRKILLRLFALISLVGYTQEKNIPVEFVDVVIYEAETRSGGKFIGVAPDEFNAQSAIDELTFIKEGSKYEIMGSSIHIMPVLIKKTVSIKEDFISEDDFLEFKYISEIELISLEYLESNKIETAISFYKSVSLEKNETIIEKRLRYLQSNYSKYLFDHESAADVVNISFNGK